MSSVRYRGSCRAAAALAALTVAPHAATGRAAAQTVPAVETALSPAGRAAVVLVAVLAAGWALDAVKPRYVDDVVATVRRELLASLVTGALALAVLAGAIYAALVTIIGIPFAVPLLILLLAGAAAGTALGFLAAFDGVVPDRRIGLGAAAVLAGVTAAVPTVGVPLVFAVASVGVGAMVRLRVA